jgi:hypothetical protein
MGTNLASFTARQAELVDHMYEFFGTTMKAESSKIDLAIWQNPVGAKAYATTVECVGEGILQKRLKAISDFLAENKFTRVEESYREDIHVNADGVVARLNLVEMPGMQPSLRLLVQMPESIDEADLVKTYYNYKPSSVKSD